MGRKNVATETVYDYIEYMPKNGDYMKGITHRVTYKEIQEYCEETYGLKVHAKYIGELKTECGFEKRDNYNKGSGKTRELKCPPEKREAILAAFKNFGLL